MHGTMTTYRKGCRCDDCRAANAQRVRDNRAARRDRLNHGTRSAYDAGCRESCCRAARVDAYNRLEGRRPHRWRDLIMAEFCSAWQAWWERMESITLLYPTEVSEYGEPQPTLKSFMVGLGHALH